MNKRKITAFRPTFLLIATIFTTWGSYMLGKQLNVLLPIFSCAYVPSSGAIGVCQTLATLGLTLASGAGTALLSVLGMVAVCTVGILLLGRLWCGYVCPFGFYQELLSMIRKKLRLPGIRIPESARPVLRAVKWLLVLCLLFGIGFCSLCPVRFIMPSLAASAARSIL